jgi:radical SAM superfamily enzyme YgiQ (UPF0313 family)
MDHEKIKVQHTLFKEENGHLIHQVAALSSVMINLDEIRDEQIAEKRRRPDPMLWALEMGLHSGSDQIDRYEGLIWIPPKL